MPYHYSQRRVQLRFKSHICRVALRFALTEGIPVDYGLEYFSISAKVFITFQNLANSMVYLCSGDVLRDTHHIHQIFLKNANAAVVHLLLLGIGFVLIVGVPRLARF